MAVREGNSIYDPQACRYDPIGRMWDPCENTPSKLSFDGNNVVRTGGDATESTNEFRFSFVHGPGMDDPILGRKGTQKVQRIEQFSRPAAAAGDSSPTSLRTVNGYDRTVLDSVADPRGIVVRRYSYDALDRVTTDPTTI